MTDKPTQPLLHVGSQIRDQLQSISEVDGERWQDLARQVLLNFVNMKALEAVMPAAQKAVEQ